MAEIKTRPTAVSVDDFLEAVEHPVRREDGKAMRALMEKVTGWPATMWGPSIVGFGRYHYRYASGHEGDMCRIGFSPRKPNLVLYIHRDFPRGRELADRLGKADTSKGCIYVKKLADLDQAVLEELIAASVEDMARLYPEDSSPP